MESIGSGRGCDRRGNCVGVAWGGTNLYAVCRPEWQTVIDLRPAAEACSFLPWVYKQLLPPPRRSPLKLSSQPVQVPVHHFPPAFKKCVFLRSSLGYPSRLSRLLPSPLPAPSRPSPPPPQLLQARLLLPCTTGARDTFPISSSTRLATPPSAMRSLLPSSKLSPLHSTQRSIVCSPLVTLSLLGDDCGSPYQS